MFRLCRGLACALDAQIRDGLQTGPNFCQSREAHFGKLHSRQKLLD